MPLNPHATFTVDSAVELAVVERSGFVESRHIGSAVVLAADGTVVTELGDITTPIFARSTLKPLQALASMQSGVPLRGAQVAIACGSHVGSLDHMDVVEGMLKAAGVKEDQLQCPAAWPQDETARNWLVQLRAGQVQAGLQLLRQARRVPLGVHGERLGHAQLPRTQPPAAAAHPLRDRGVLRRTHRPPGHRRLRRAGCRRLPDRPGPRLLEAGQGPGRQELQRPRRHHRHVHAGLPVGRPGPRARPTRSSWTSWASWPRSAPRASWSWPRRQGVSVAIKVLDGNLRATTLVGLTLLAASGAVEIPGVSSVLEKVVDPVLGGGRPVGKIRLGPRRLGAAGLGTHGQWPVSRRRIAVGRGPRGPRRMAGSHRAAPARSDAGSGLRRIRAVPRTRSRRRCATRLEEVTARAPGNSVEVRVPPFGVTQCVEGPRHTRGTPRTSSSATPPPGWRWSADG